MFQDNPIGITASELVDSQLFGDMLEQAVESANEAQREIMNIQPEQKYDANHIRPNPVRDEK